MKPYHLYFLAVAMQLLAACASHQTIPDLGGVLPKGREVDLSEFFSGIDPQDATFVVYNPASGKVIRHNIWRARQRFLPASTFKIPHSLIALETGVAKGPDHRIPWSPSRKPAEGFWSTEWSRAHTLRSAMQYSVYWYYQDMARHIGDERMQQYLDQFDYGNRAMGGGLDRFWLRGDLRISPDEQVNFLVRMYRGELGLKETTTQTVKDILLLEENPGYKLSGKTGVADTSPGRELAWLVGYVERDGQVWFYALNMEGEQVWELWGKSAARVGLVRDLLRELGVLARE